jgi:hypothetical protein
VQVRYVLLSGRASRGARFRGRWLCCRESSPFCASGFAIGFVAIDDHMQA